MEDKKLVIPASVGANGDDVTTIVFRSTPADSHCEVTRAFGVDLNAIGAFSVDSLHAKVKLMLSKKT